MGVTCTATGGGKGVALISLLAAAVLLLAPLTSAQQAACSRGETGTWCSAVRSEKDLWTQAVAVDAASGASYVTGHFSGRADFPNHTAHTAKAGLDIFVMKVADDSVQWVSSMTPWATQGSDILPIGFVSEYMKVKKVALSPDGSLLYLAGHYSGIVEANGQQLLRSMEEISQDVFVMQLNARTGRINWATSVGGDSIDNVHDLVVNEDSAYVCGTFFHMAEFGKHVLYTPHGFQGSFAMRLSRAGAVVWAQSVEYALPDYELADVRAEGLGLPRDSNNLRITGSLGAPKTTSIATTKSMPSMFTTLVDKRTGTYVDGSQDFFAYFSSTLMSVSYDPEHNSVVSVFWCDDQDEGVVVDAGHAVWCTDNHEKVMAMKLDLVDSTHQGTITYLSEVADAFLLGGGRVLEPSVSVVQHHGQAYLAGSIEGMVTFSDGSPEGRTVRSSTPQVFLARLGLTGALKSVETFGGEGGVVMATALAKNANTGALALAGVFKGQLRTSSGSSLVASTAEKWDIYTATLASQAAVSNADLLDLYSDPSSQAVVGGSSLATGSRLGVVNSLLQMSE